MRREVPAYVYFARQLGGFGPVKIGCSGWPERRLVDLMQWSPIPLEIVAKMPGNEALEWRFHARFLDQHSHREWFHPSRQLDETILQVRAGTFDTSTLPAPLRLQDFYRAQPRLVTKVRAA